MTPTVRPITTLTTYDQIILKQPNDWNLKPTEDDILECYSDAEVVVKVQVYTVREGKHHAQMIIVPYAPTGQFAKEMFLDACEKALRSIVSSAVMMLEYKDKTAVQWYDVGVASLDPEWVLDNQWVITAMSYQPIGCQIGARPLVWERTIDMFNSLRPFAEEQHATGDLLHLVHSLVKIDADLHLQDIKRWLTEVTGGA